MLVALDHQNGIRKVYWDVRGSELTQNTRLSCVCDISCMKQIFVNQDTDPRRWDSMFWNIYPISFAFWPGHRISAIMLPHDQRSRCDQPYTSPLTYQMEACSFQWSCCTPMSPLVCLRHFVVPCLTKAISIPYSVFQLTILLSIVTLGIQNCSFAICPRSVRPKRHTTCLNWYGCISGFTCGTNLCCRYITNHCYFSLTGVILLPTCL